MRKKKKEKKLSPTEKKLRWQNKLLYTIILYQLETKLEGIRENFESSIINFGFIVTGIMISFSVAEDPNWYLYLVSLLLVYINLQIILNWKSFFKWKKVDKDLKGLSNLIKIY